MKKVLVITGSPRKNGNTEILANAFIDGAKAADNTVETVSVIGKKINGCIGCNNCYRDPLNKCAYNDDMTELYEKMAQADVFVFATPIYFYNVSSQLKCLIDRLHNPIRKTFKVKKLGLLAVCADTKKSVFDSVKQMYADTLDYFSLENGGIITVYGVSEKGDINGNKALDDAFEMGKSI